MYDLPLVEMSGPRFLRTRRLALGLSQKQVADRVGTTQSVIAAIETKRRTLTPDMEAKMRKAMVARPGELLQRHQERVKKEVVDFGFANARVFGSVARGEDIPDSDIDIFVDLTDESAAGVGELFALTDRLENILSVRVDLKTVPTDTTRRTQLQKALEEAVAV